MYAAALTEIIVHGKIKNIIQISCIIFLVVSLVFMSFYAGFLALLPLLLSVLVNLGFMGLTGIWLSVATATISAMAIGLGADYTIYYMFRFREEMSKGLGWEKALAETEIPARPNPLCGICRHIGLYVPDVIRVQAAHLSRHPGSAGHDCMQPGHLDAGSDDHIGFKTKIYQQGA